MYKLGENQLEYQCLMYECIWLMQQLIKLQLSKI